MGKKNIEFLNIFIEIKLKINKNTFTDNTETLTC